MSDRDALIEVMARVVAEGFYFGMPQVDPDAVPDGLAKDIARAALTAIEAAGVRLVPVEATMEMQHAVSVYHIPHSDTYGNYADLDIQSAARDIYVTMLAASPYAPEGG